MTENKFIEKYDNPTIRTLIQLVPFGVGSALDVALSETIEGIREKRSQIFFDELSKGNIELTDETINNEEFLHSYFSTRRAAANTFRKEKIETFARIFKNGIIDNKIKNTEDYEDFLKIIDQLSFLDMQCLNELKQFEEDYPNKKGQEENKPFVEPTAVLPDWHSELKNILNRLDLNESEFRVRLYRLQSMGLFERSITIRDDVSLLEDPDFVGRLTPIAHKIFELIEDY